MQCIDISRDGIDWGALSKSRQRKKVVEDVVDKKKSNSG